MTKELVEKLMGQSDVIEGFMILSVMGWPLLLPIFAALSLVFFWKSKQTSGSSKALVLKILSLLFLLLALVQVWMIYELFSGQIRLNL